VPTPTDGEHHTGHAPLGSALAAAILSLWAVRPAVGVHDSGELAAAAYSLGIAHPAGSPLWIMLAKGFSLLPTAGGIALRMALLSVVATSLTAAVATAILRRTGAPGGAAAIGGLAVVLLPRPFWAGTMIEVYALQLLLATVFVASVWPTAGRETPVRTAARAGLSGGLLLSVHHSLAPAVFLVLIGTGLAGTRRGRRLTAAGLGLAAGLTPYLELPFRALRSPGALWTDTATLSGLWRHLTSAQYRTGGFPHGGGLPRLLEALGAVGAPAAFLVLPLAAAGLAVLWRHSRAGAAALAILWATDLGVVVRLQTMPLDSEAYLVVASGMTGLAAAAALAAAARRLPALVPATAAAPILLLTVLPLPSGRTTEPARWTTARRMAAAPRGAVLWLRGDSVAFPAVYQQLVEGWRPDLTILHPWGFVGSPWLPETVRAHAGEPAARERRDRMASELFGKAAAAGRPVLFQDRAARGAAVRARGTLWTAERTPPPPAAATLSPLPLERRWRHDVDPTVRGLAQMDHLPLGFTAAAAGDRDGARREARMAADSFPSFATVHRALGQGWLDLGLVPEAVLELRRAVRLDADVPETWLALGVALVRNGEPDAARAAWERAATLRPGWAAPLVNLARLALRSGDRAAARKWAALAAAAGDAEGRDLARRLATPSRQ